MKLIAERPFLPKPPGTESQYIATLMRCMTTVLGEIAYRLNGTLPKDGTEVMKNPLPLLQATKVELLGDTGPDPDVAPVYPAADWTGALVYCTNETGGATIAFSDGTNWRRVQDRAVVS